MINVSMNTFYAIVGFLAALGPLIVIHELGHLLVARWCGVKVLRFSFGFGKPLVKFVLGADRTEWAIAPIPLGGYVAMLDERELKPGVTIDPADLPRAFNRQTVWKRIAIVAAGPLANLLLAVALYWGLGLHGVEEPRAVLAAPVAGSLAAASGLDAGGEVRALNGEPVASMIDLRWKLLKLAVDHAPAQLELIAPEGRPFTVELDFSGIGKADLESDFMGRIGLKPARPWPIVGPLDADGAAQRDGLRTGDRVLELDGRALTGVDEMIARIRASAGQPLLFTVERNDQDRAHRLDIVVTPDARPDAAVTGAPQVGRIGAAIHGGFPLVTVRYGPLESLGKALYRTWDTSAFTLRMLGKMLVGDISLKNLSGPVTIADYAGQTVRLGAAIFITFIAFISISIGLMNLMPIPLLDGGHLLYYFVEIISGHAPSERFLEVSQRVGIVLLAGLMGIALFNDFYRLLS